MLLSLSLAAGVAACGGSGDDDASGAGATAASAPGQIVGAGSTAQELAQEVWTTGFKGEKVSYEPVGSEEGRSRFLAGDTAFAASDAPLDVSELAEAVERCKPGEPIELPVYISPITVFPNLKLTAFELAPATLAKIFTGEITRWDDQTIQRENPSIGPIGLPPKLAITPVGLTEEPVMTEQLTAYLAYEAPKDWKYGTSSEWPIEGDETAEDAVSVDEVVGGEAGAVSYTDFGHVGQLFGVTRLAAKGSYFVEPSAPTATQRLSNAHLDKSLSKGPRMLPVEQKRKVPLGSYPLVLVSYLIACSEYESADETAAMDAYVKYVAGQKGQRVASEQAGTAYAPPWLRKQVAAAIR